MKKNKDKECFVNQLKNIKKGTILLLHVNHCLYAIKFKYISELGCICGLNENGHPAWLELNEVCGFSIIADWPCHPSSQCGGASCYRESEEGELITARVNIPDSFPSEEPEVQEHLPHQSVKDLDITPSLNNSIVNHTLIQEEHINVEVVNGQSIIESSGNSFVKP